MEDTSAQPPAQGGRAVYTLLHSSADSLKGVAAALVGLCPLPLGIDMLCSGGKPICVVLQAPWGSRRAMWHALAMEDRRKLAWLPGLQASGWW